MIADNPKIVVPKLRFPEFRGEGGWQFQPLNNIAAPISESVGTSKCVPMSVTTGVGLLSQEEKFGRTIAGNSYKNYIRLQTNDFAYNKSATKEFPQGYIARYSGTRDAAVPNSIFTCFRPDTAAVLPEYLDHLFHGNHHGRWLRTYITVGARAHGALSVSDEALMSMPVPLPPIRVSRPEQHKIADCLNSLDDLIAAERQKLEALRQHKQGLMQQIFPREGETVPRLRFPEFKNEEEWRLGSVAELVDAGCLYSPKDGNHGDLHPKASDYVSDGIPFVMASDLKWGLIDTSSCNFISQELADNLKKGFARKGDVLLSHKGTVGEVAVVREIKTPYLMLTPQVTYYRVRDSNKISNEFLAQFFVSEFFQSNLLAASGGGTRSYIGITEQAKLCLFLPKDITEQQRVASCLTTLDDSITAQRKKVETLKTHKKGLVQQLFPSLEDW